MLMLMISGTLSQGLKNVCNSPVGKVGGFPRGLSGGERKRCNIGRGG